MKIRYRYALDINKIEKIKRVIKKVILSCIPKHKSTCYLVKPESFIHQSFIS